MDYKIEFSDKKISPWGGISLMKKMLDKMNINEILSQINLPKQESNRGFSPLQLIHTFWISLWCGANRFEHIEVIRRDDVIKQMYNWREMPGHKSFQRYFRKFTQSINQDVFGNLYKWFFSNLIFDNYTLDFDSTVITRYGQQDGSLKGYNPSKRGRNSHHPLMAFISDIRMIANFWLRSGNTSASNNFLGFLEDTMSRLENKKIGLIRCDSGFYSDDIFNYLENHENSINYIVAAKFYTPLKRRLAVHKTWLKLDYGIEIAECEYQSPSWSKSRRLIMIRQNIEKRPKAVGKQLNIFEGLEDYYNYRYSCFVTNLTLPAKVVYDLYRGRADAENRIKEVKQDFGADSFNMQNFWATEASLNFVMFAYNLMSLFRQNILGEKVQRQLKTLRYKLFAIGSYFVKDGNFRILRLALEMKRREWVIGIWKSANDMNWPAFFP